MPELHRGKIAKPPRILAVRPLAREDLGTLRETRVQPRVRAFRDTHHRLARLCAVGLRDSEILRLTGYSQQRLGTLRSDPAFQQLIAMNREKVDTGPVDEFAETSISNMLRAERQLEEHLDIADDSGDLLPLKTLLAITSDRADRFGYPKKKELNSNHVIDFARDIEARMARSGRGSVIDAKANPGNPIFASTARELPPPESPSPPIAPSAGVRRRF